MGRGHIGHDLGSYEGCVRYVPSHMRPFLFGCHISFCCFFALEVMRGHDFLTHLKMCHNIRPTSGHIKILPGMCQVIWDHFYWGVIFHSVAFLHSEVIRGHDFWTHLKMCVIIFDLLPPILQSGTVSGEMGS